MAIEGQVRAYGKRCAVCKRIWVPERPSEYVVSGMVACPHCSVVHLYVFDMEAHHAIQEQSATGEVRGDAEGGDDQPGGVRSVEERDLRSGGFAGTDLLTRGLHERFADKFLNQQHEGYVPIFRSVCDSPATNASTSYGAEGSAKPEKA